MPPTFRIDGDDYCVERRIWLKRGRYRWKMYLAVNNRADLVTAWTRYIDLRAGWYRWKDCLGAPTGDQAVPTFGGMGSACM